MSDLISKMDSLIELHDPFRKKRIAQGMVRSHFKRRQAHKHKSGGPGVLPWKRLAQKPAFIAHHAVGAVTEAGDRNWPGHEEITWTHHPEKGNEPARSHGWTVHGEYSIMHPHSSLAKAGYKGWAVRYKGAGSEESKSLGHGHRVEQAISAIAQHHKDQTPTATEPTTNGRRPRAANEGAPSDVPHDKCNACKGPFHPATGHQISPTMKWCGRCAHNFKDFVVNHTSMVKYSKGKVPKGEKRKGHRFYDYAMVPPGTPPKKVEDVTPDVETPKYQPGQPSTAAKNISQSLATAKKVQPQAQASIQKPPAPSAYQAIQNRDQSAALKATKKQVTPLGNTPKSGAKSVGTALPAPAKPTFKTP